ncbi:MAG: hypothetical protein M9951_11860 [Burkholderiaceae bacterium]|jgi:hypothetical protein|nr:hypothetical protein [Burkholderiaceae bacterium]
MPTKAKTRANLTDAGRVATRAKTLGFDLARLDTLSGGLNAQLLGSLVPARSRNWFKTPSGTALSSGPRT